MSRVRALLATARIANVPSVVSNVFTGYLLSYWLNIKDPSNPKGITFAIISGIALYVAGNFANDWFDRKWDQTHRPERALPSGLFSPLLYLFLFLVLSIAGITLGFFVSPGSGFVALMIALSVTIYTRIHKQSAWGVTFVALCRALLIFLGLFTRVSPSLMFHEQAEHLNDIVKCFVLISPYCVALGLFSYIVGLSLFARAESKPSPATTTSRLAIAMLFLPLITHTYFILLFVPWAPVLAALPFAIWTIRTLTRWRKPIPTLVSRLLGGIPLIDAILSLQCLLLLNDHQGISPAMYLLPFIPFAIGLLLQRVAPAT